MCIDISIHAYSVLAFADPLRLVGIESHGGARPWVRVVHGGLSVVAGVDESGHGTIGGDNGAEKRRIVGGGDGFGQSSYPGASTE